MSKAKRPAPEAGEGRRGTSGHIAYLLRQACGAARLAHDAALAEAGLTTPQFLVLNLLDAYPHASGAELARVAHLTPQTVNLIVRKLERDRLIARTSHRTHGRILCLELTSEGRARLKRCKSLADAVERRLLGLLDPQAEAKVRRWLVDVAILLGRQ
jgi:DNA-binding MarR family transcriptional regulator